ncbi:MAG: RnfABCDGE type electron transport complex subunit D [Treponemataceae bacterium]|nr:RnfABCDGE type electron transport complex subunit D [Treponemataceae bacterium]
MSDAIGRLQLKRRNRRVLVRPFMYRCGSVENSACKLLLLLCVQLGMLALAGSFRALLVVLAAALGSIAAGFVSRKMDGRGTPWHLSAVISAVQGIMVGMMLPEAYPPATVFFVTLCAMLFIQHFFGGFSCSWLNAPAFAVAVMWLVGSKAFPSLHVSSELLSLRNPLQRLIEGGVYPVQEFDAGVTAALNGAVFKLFKVSVPEGYVSLFWDARTSIPAFRFNAVTLASSAVLFGDDLLRCVVPACFTAAYLALVRFAAPFFFDGIRFQGDMLLALLTGGTLFCAVFLLDWFGTAPESVAGKVLYGISAGIIAFLISGCGTSPCGMAFTVVIGNIVSILIQMWEERRNRRALRAVLAAEQVREDE